MQLSDTIEFMISKDWKERLKAEYWQAMIRVENLENYINSDNVIDSPEAGVDLLLLTVQRDIMYSYLTSLYNRIIMLGLEEYIDDTSDMCGIESICASDNISE
jgi:hypothetical protein